MKFRLIGLLIFLAGWANAQIGIDLTEMVPAPDSGYMIITTGDEYPERGLQKYVKAADVLGLDTMFQNGDSLCLLFRHEDSYRCFPVHQAPRFEIIDEGLRVCWEQRDTVWDTRAYLHFPGTPNSYVEARDIHDFEIGDQDAEIEVGIRIDSGYTALTGIAETKTLGDNTKGWIIGGHENGTFYYVQTADGYERSGHMSARWSDFWDADWHDLMFNYIVSDGKAEYFIDQVLRQERSNPLLENVYIENSFPLRFGRDAVNRRFHGDIRHFRFSDEYILFEESYGKDTLITNKGTVLDILGDVEWRRDTLGFTSIDTSHHCEIIPLTDTRLISVEHIDDSVRYTLSDSTIFTVRDSFIPQENIIGWIDDRIPDTVFFAKTSTATKAIEFGDTLELKGGAININIPVEIDYFPATNQLQVCWTEIELPEGGLQQKPGFGEEFGEQENEVQQLPADTIRLCDTIQLNDVFVDTVIHDGAGWVFYRNDGKVWSVRDSFRTDDEILDLIEMMNDPQWLTLDRDGNEITIGITEGNEVSFELPEDKAIGGRNLLYDSRFLIGGVSRGNSMTSRRENARMENGVYYATRPEGSNSPILLFRPMDMLSDLDTNSIYTISFLTDIRSVTSTNPPNHVNAIQIDKQTIQLGDLWLHWVVFRPTSRDDVTLYQYFSGVAQGEEFGLWYVQLQEGNYPTTWHPAPEDLEQDLSGIRDTLSTHDARLLSLEYFRDTLGIPDIASFTHDGDSIHLTMKDGRSWTVPDKHFTEQEIKDMIAQESPVNHSWLLKDGGVPDNASDTVYREGVAVIEGGAYDRYMSGDQDRYVWDGESDDPVVLQYVQDQSGNDMAAQALVPNVLYTIGIQNSSDPSDYERIQLSLGHGIVLDNYGQGNRIAEPDYLLGVDQFGLVKEVRPTSGIDTIIHLGDSVFFDFDDKTFTIRDSVRSDADIITLIEANRIFQQLGRSGDFITLSDGGQVLDLHLKNVTHTGDSIRLHLSDGRTLSVRDSSLSVEAVRDMILEEIPETVFYVKQGDVTAPVNWGDIVELENGTVNVNMPTKVKMIDSLNALEVCIWQVVDRTVVDTAIMDYLYFNGVDAYGSSVLPNSDNPFDLPAGFRVSFDDPINQEQTLYSNGGEVNNNQFSIRIPASLEDLSMRVSGSNIIRIDVDDLSPGEVDLIEYKPIGDNIGGYLNGELKDQIPGFNYPFVGTQGRQLGRYNSSNPRLFKGKMYEFWWGDNHYPLTEGSGTTITSTTGAEFNLYNTVWGKDTIITVHELIDTLFQCDTVYLKDWYVKNATFENDTLTLVRSDGIEMSVEIQASGGDGIDTMYSTQDSLYIVTSTGRTLSAGVAKGDKGDGLEYHWDGTRLGVRIENSGDPYVYVDLKGEKGDTGADGREIELRVDSDIIQWRYVGDTWQTLIPLSALKGEKGDPGPGLEYHWDGTKLGVRVEGSGDPFVYVDLKGEKGDPGDVVGDINIYKDDGVITDSQRTLTVGPNKRLTFDLESGNFEMVDTFVYDKMKLKTNQHGFEFNIRDWDFDNDEKLSESKIRLHNLLDLNYQHVPNFEVDVKSIIDNWRNVIRMNSDGIQLIPLQNEGETWNNDRRRAFVSENAGIGQWAKLDIEDVGITPTDTARWGAGGSYTLERDNYRMHLRDAGGASKGSFQLQGADGVEIYPQANNVFRISGANAGKTYRTAVNGPAIQLREDGNTVSTTNFFGTGGINIQGTGSTITIDGSGIGGIQSLSFNPSLTQTTLSGGGGSFRIVGGTNTNVSLSSGGVYTISSTAAGDTREIVRGGTNNDWIMMSGSSVGVIDRYVSGFSKSGNNITLNRTDGLGGVTFSIADGDSDPTNELQTLSHNTSTQTTTLSQSGGSFRLVGGANMSVSNTSAGVYTLNASVPSYTFETVNNTLQLKRNGVTVSTLKFNEGDIAIASSGTPNDRILTFWNMGSSSAQIAPTIQSIDSGIATSESIYSNESAGVITLPVDVEEGDRKYVIFDGDGIKTVNTGGGRTVNIESGVATEFVFYNGKWFPIK